MKPTKITNRHIMFTTPTPWWGNHTNMGLILGKHRNYLVDTGMGRGSVAPVVDMLKSHKKPLFVINTHSDCDHVWGNWVFADYPIIAHKLCREILDKNWDEQIAQWGEFIDVETRKCLPNITFEGEMHFPDDEIRLFHTPGHTHCGISVLDVVDKVLYVGDNIGDEEDIIPHIYGSVDDYRATIDFYDKLDFEICISGHNKPQPKSVITLIKEKLG